MSEPKKPRKLKLDKWSNAEAFEAWSGYSDGDKLSCPREAVINTCGLNVRKAKRLIKWLNEFVEWGECD